MNKVLIIIKSPGIGDLQILLSNIHHISRTIGKPVTVLAQKNTRAKEVFKYDSQHVNEVLDLGKRDFLNIINKIRSRKFGKCYIYSDSIRLYFIALFGGIRKIYHYPFFSKRGKNFYKTAQQFSEKILETKIDSNSKVNWNRDDIEKTKKKFGIESNIKNIVCGISASGPTKRWDIDNYIKLFQKINSEFSCKFFLAGGQNDEILIEKVMSSVENCISLSKLSMEQIIPIIASCQYYIGGDTGFGHLSANLESKCLMLFCDSPPSAYGLWNSNIKIIVPYGETIKSTRHNTRGKDKISFNEVLQKSLDLIS
ncbi:hypothetical protein OAJ18_01230 [Pelagibacteraceae bacterium]|nr:hypothetical protein [Pelagibacteraceae bacterium]